MNLKSILLKEFFEPPTDQVVNGALKEFSRTTGLTVKNPMPAGTNNTSISYTIPLTTELQTPLLQLMFQDMVLNFTVTSIPTVIGGYLFTFNIMITNLDNTSDAHRIGTIFYKNGKFISRIK